MFVLSLACVLLALRMASQGAYNLSELTVQTIPVRMRTLIQSYPTRSVKSCSMHKEMVFHKKFLEKAYIILKMTGLASQLTFKKHP